MDYPLGFARRMLVSLPDWGSAWKNVDLVAGQVDLVSEYDSIDMDDEASAISARIVIDDEGIAPYWDGLVREGTHFYPHLTVEESVVSILTVIIDEYTATDYTPAPRLFTVRQILSGDPPKNNLFPGARH